MSMLLLPYLEGLLELVECEMYRRFGSGAAMMRRLPDVVNEAAQLPLRVHLRRSAQLDAVPSPSCRRLAVGGSTVPIGRPEMWCKPS
jgi:hypothetical protein